MIKFFHNIRQNLLNEGKTSKYLLYAIDRFFVKVKWDINKDDIIGKAAFKYGGPLDKYSNVPKEI